MKKAFAMILCVALVLSLFAGCGAKKSDSDLAYVQNKGVLVVGITDYAPMDYKDANGDWTGFDAEFARLVAKELGVGVRFFVIADWSKKVFELDSMNIDCIWNGMTINEELLSTCSVSDPYVVNAQVVVMKNDVLANYADAASLVDLTFAVENGSAGQTAAQDIGVKNIVAVQDQAAALMEVAAGTADACVIDITMAQNMTGEGTDYAALDIAFSLTSEEYGIAFRKGSDITAKLNEILDQFRQDGTLQALADKYNLTLAE
jgi:polar amino acid transport system substrate-binding protein